MDLDSPKAALKARSWAPLSVISLAGVAFWSTMTVLLGAGTLWGAWRESHPSQVVVSPDSSSVTVVDSNVDQLTFWFVVFPLWGMALLPLLAALLLGIIEIAVRQRSVIRCVLYAVVVIGGPIAAMTGDNHDLDFANGQPSHLAGQMLWLGLQLVFIGVAVSVLSYVLLDPRKRHSRVKAEEFDASFEHGGAA